MRDAVPQAEVCVFARVFARVYVCARRTLKLTGTVHIRACKNGRLKEYSLKHSLCLKVNENSWEKIVCVNILF